jgi:cell division septation protein DedD
MPTMATFRVGHILLIAVLAALGACSQEQQDWRSAESADSSEGWAHFLEQHPDSELAPQARERIAKLAEERDWKHADSLKSADAYRAFLSRHPTGRLAEEARIHIEGFALGSAPRIAPPSEEEVQAWHSASGVRALQMAAGPPPGAAPAAEQPPADAIPASTDSIRAEPGEAAQAPPTAAVTAPAGDAPGASVNASAMASEVVAASYGVQLGAFDSHESADHEWQRLRGEFGSELNGLSPRIVLASTNVGTLYRLQAPASDEAQARAICDSLRQREQACVPVLPR